MRSRLMAETNTSTISQKVQTVIGYVATRQTVELLRQVIQRLHAECALHFRRFKRRMSREARQKKYWQAMADNCTTVTLGDPLHPISKINVEWNRFASVSSFPLTPAAHLSLDSEEPEGNYWEAKRIWMLDGARVHTKSGLVVADKALVKQSVPLWTDASYAFIAAGLHGKQSNKLPVVRVSKPVFPIPRGTTYNYYHFVVEYLPRLMRAVRQVPNLHVVVAAPHRHVIELLETLKVPTISAPNCWLEPEIVVLADPVSENWIHPEDAELLRSFAQGGNVSNRGSKGTKIFVSRLGVSRTLQNEERLAAHLAADGFFVFSSLSGLPVQDQIALFADASIVIGLHGAGLVNTLWAQRQLDVMELLPETWKFTNHVDMFRGIAAARGDRYSREELAAVEHAHYGTANQAQKLCDEWLQSL
jgi:hypothetical protein